MAGKIQINRITNANIYLDGNNLLGRASEIKLPDISMIMQEHKALGMVGKIELPAVLTNWKVKLNGTRFTTTSCVKRQIRGRRWHCSAAPASIVITRRVKRIS